MRTDCLSPATIVAALLAPPTLAAATPTAQFVESNVTTIYSLAGEAPGDNFGLELVAVGDYDGDGARELLVSAPGNDQGATNAGKVYLFDGATGALVRSHAGTRVNEARRNVCDAGDVDADGAVDYLVGTGDGWVYVYSGASGAQLHAFSGAPGEAFGFRACGVGDMDGDGHGEILVGAWSNDSVAPNAGCAYLFSGASGALMRRHCPGVIGTQFGHTVASLDDLDGDGVREYSVGAPGPYSPNIPGEVYVFSGATGLELAPRLAPLSTGRIFGAWVPSCGGQDLTSDGVAEFTVTDLGDTGTDRGRLYVYDGATRATLFSIPGFSFDSGFGGVPPNPTSCLGDVTGDGVPDILVGSWESKVGAFNGGQADILDGADGTRWRSITSTVPGAFLGGSAAGLGLVDADALPDFALGANGEDSSRGRVYVLAGASPIGTSYCDPAVPNSTGQPGVARAEGSEFLAANEVVLIAEQLPPGSLGYFLASAVQGSSQPAGSSGVLCLGGLVGRYAHAVGAGPAFSVPIDLTSIPTPHGPIGATAGVTWNFQAWHRDVGGTSNFTSGVSIRLR